MVCTCQRLSTWPIVSPNASARTWESVTRVEETDHTKDQGRNPVYGRQRGELACLVCSMRVLTA